MVKIKRKVEMTLAELIEWAWKNDVNSRRFTSSNDTSVTFSEYGDFVTSVKYIFKDETFNVEIEEEITEETKLPKFLVIFLDMSVSNYNETPAIGEDESIKEILQGNENRPLTIKAIHLINDDGTHTLIWKNGELVGDE